VALLMPRHENHRWVTVLDRKGFAVSTGSACAAGNDHPSHVLAALRVSPESIRRSIRVSSGWGTSREDWRALAAAIVETAADLDRTEPATVTP
jgi:cysteine desulfurase